ncbi:unnamed protein product [Brassica rapa]|uniref:Uncharacterized protein n=3 Tax=Brassica TaxID=3705 RepID=A0A3P6CIP2_BRACM|nr:unnamed protein product [Brassica napus]CAG7899732.1 unnamed protein product [Brassica rapa]VDD07459.1 unnamed protein product [Brassica rapa]
MLIDRNVHIIDLEIRIAVLIGLRLIKIQMVLYTLFLIFFTGWVIKAMVLDGIVSSPLRRHQSLKKQWEDLGSCSTVVNRHRYLLTALLLLGFLCTVYLYFAVTLDARHNSSCYGLAGKEKAMCQAISKGKLKLF